MSVTELERKLNTYISAIQEFVNKKYEEYRRMLEKVSELWMEYKRAVEELKRRWDVDNALIYSKIEELKNEMDLAKQMIEMLRVKRELEIIDEETYSSGLATLNEIISRIGSLYEELRQKYDEIENKIKEHWIRSIDTMAISAEKIDMLLQEIENARSRGEIDETTYERLLRDLEVLRRVVQALEIIKSTPRY
ncbi:MAG: hypothetical protein GXO10_03170 [Crenarchaeota archaeon]|nr:hypothetical protein [Thermoproteota archaeon]